jgi:hypothetical protein
LAGCVANDGEVAMGQRRIGQASLAKALLPAQGCRLTDPRLEEALADRLSFRRLCGFGLAEARRTRPRGADSAPPWPGVAWPQRCAPRGNRQLDARGLVLKAGLLIAATLVDAAVARPP